MPNSTASETAGEGLRGLPVVVTRPVGQAERLCRMLADAGARVVPFPTLAIVAPRDGARRDAVLDRFSDFDMAIFISANAVHRGVGALASRGGSLAGLALAAVGMATAKALREAGYPPSLVPRTGYDSESLLALPELAAEAVAGRRVVIVRGEGGRELLARALTERGATVEYAEVYRRIKAAPDLARLRGLEARSAATAVVATSAEGLENLFAIAGADHGAWLRDARFVVISERLARRVRELGVGPAPLVAARATDAAIVEALKRWRNG